ncbi:MAG: DUF6434 domain-containing protein [Pseudomonadota bacterium]
MGKPSQAPSVSGKARRKSRFNWSNAELNEHTRITDNVSFGPNVRNWFKRRIGPAFVCHSDFMDWVRSNTGATLGDAIEAWYTLEKREAEPGFRHEIALCNNYLRYLRDARDDNPALSHEQAMECWHAKKLRPASDGFVIYEKDDLRFLD